MKSPLEETPILAIDSSPQSNTIDLSKTLTPRQLDRKEETALFQDIKSLYREALYELSNAPGILATLPRLDEVVNEHKVSLSLLMNRGDLTPFQLKEKYIQLLDNAQKYYHSENYISAHQSENERTFFNDFAFSTAVVDILGPQYCSMVKSGELGVHARESGHKIKELLSQIQPLKEKLFESEDPLLISAVKARAQALTRGFNKNIEISDLLQEARQSIVTALHRFDPDQGNYFHTYADDWIGKAVGEELASSRSIIRVPDWALETLSKESIKNNREGIFSPENIEGSKSESLEKARKALRPLLLSTPVAQSVEDGDTSTLAETLVDDEDNQFESDLAYYNKNKEIVLNKIAQVLEPKEFRIIAMRSGLDGRDPADFQSISDELGIAPGTVRQIHRRALQKVLAAVAGYESKLGLFEVD